MCGGLERRSLLALTAEAFSAIEAQVAAACRYVSMHHTLVLPLPRPSLPSPLCSHGLGLFHCCLLELAAADVASASAFTATSFEADAHTHAHTALTTRKTTRSMTTIATTTTTTTTTKKKKEIWKELLTCLLELHLEPGIRDKQL